jgi:hypothetical protein
MVDKGELEWCQELTCGRPTERNPESNASHLAISDAAACATEPVKVTAGA